MLDVACGHGRHARHLAGQGCRVTAVDVVVVHYLHRPLLPRHAEALRSDGLLLYETFAVGNERFGRPRNPDFLLRPRELLDAFAGLRVLAFEDGIIAGPTPAAIQRLAAVKLEPDAIEPVETLVL